MPESKIVGSEDLSPKDAKWVTLKKLRWTDPTGKERVWEAAERTTRGSSGIDAVAILAILRSETKKFPTSVVIVEQFRPPVGKYVVELPAGLIDGSETPEDAAIRELEEETGFKAQSVLESSPILVSNPGMTNANSKLVMVDVPFKGDLELSEQKLDSGEFVTRRIVELSKLNEEFDRYAQQGYLIGANLAHFAHGYDLARKLESGQLAGKLA
ncbi:NUDIX hydrolase [Phanerochaete sordida]|uniref:NUDIX hydrolase n=1 Tax=Phanerochaete sordida TaxID=48140 RepID=A0A9P3GJH8_9APHY|nr:NUDIX hydrolase [Phanerochaete sordida]